MAKYHLNNKYEPGECKARSGNCPLAPAGEHYDTLLEALVSAEKKLVESNDLFSTQTKKEIIWHLGDKGSVEECPYRDGYCEAKPHGKATNIHTKNKEEAESTARALREIVGRENSQKKTPATKTVESKPVKENDTTRKARDTIDSYYDSKRKAGWTEKEIQTYRDSCGHTTPTRFLPKIKYGC